ncbi:MAG: transposase [Deltaproteobacteria bacterium]|nr:transposase [Deltaproteobacteria bacterium]
MGELRQPQPPARRARRADAPRTKNIGAFILDDVLRRAHHAPMARPRKRHIQQSLFKQRGGKRARAGRRITPGRYRASEPHRARPKVTKSTPVHVTLRVVQVLHVLRTLDTYRALRQAMVCVYRRANFRIVGISIEQSHVHLLVEAHDKLALARGMQAFQISAAKRLNAVYSKWRGLSFKDRRRGCVFTDRYNEEVITNRRQARHAWSYVLNNWRRHNEDRVPELRGFAIDPFSSAPSFDGWARPIRESWPPTYEPLPVRRAASWLLTVGWRMYGLIDPHEVPGKRTDRQRGTAASDALRALGLSPLPLERAARRRYSDRRATGTASVGEREGRT